MVRSYNIVLSIQFPLLVNEKEKSSVMKYKFILAHTIPIKWRWGENVYKLINKPTVNKLLFEMGLIYLKIIMVINNYTKKKC